ncbi:MAG: monovalent cation:proton antiporter-2 (CPA2) family protein [Alphaproteobacteria bacterium]|nr:monovalent cation:proton antiporter-2 (CPA2) family protein [Alphaproteobacteria bacterium]
MDGLVFQVIGFLLAAIIAPPLFKRLGFGVVVGYLCAGILIGPHGFRVFPDPEAVMDVAQLGIVLLLFVIGLDTRISKLIALRGDIMGLGIGQVGLTTLALAGLAVWCGLSVSAALLVGFAFALSGTAIALQILDERGDLPSRYGQRSFAVLLTQDMLTVPVLALVPILFLGGGGTSATGSPMGDALLAIGTIAGIILSGRYLLDPIFRIIAASGAREVMTAAALLVVLGAALAASVAGISMALGAFLAGVMLAESSYRHQIQADVEPFRGLLLALFFMSIGMIIPVATVLGEAFTLGLLLLGYLALKVLVVAGVAMALGSSRAEALRIGLLLAAAGEFAFVLVPVAGGAGLIDSDTAGRLIALAALSMIVMPPVAMASEGLIRRFRRVEAGPEEDYEGANGTVLVIGFGRVGQIASQILLSQGVEATLIDYNPDRIKSAARFGFKVYYGDGRRIDVLHAAGASQARVILVCLGDPNESLAICAQLRRVCPNTRIYATAYDRTHAIALMEAGIDFQIRETFDAAIIAGREVLLALGIDPERAAEVEADVRQRDADRLALQRLQGIEAGIDLMHQKTMLPEPLKQPDHLIEPVDLMHDTVPDDPDTVPRKA